MDTPRLQPVRVDLSHFELAMASHVGWMRQMVSLREGRKDAHGFAGLGWSEHCEGACGELAVAKVLGIYWNGSVDTFGGADLGTKIQVKTRSRDDYQLLVRKNDAKDHAFVLVTGKAPTFRVHGWMFGAEAQNEEWLETHGGREPAYFPPNDRLRPISQLLAILAGQRAAS